MSDGLCSQEFIRQLSGGYSQPARQLAELHKQGFWRARRSRLTGKVVLEQAHYDAVCQGRDAAAPQRRPQVRPVSRTA